MEILLFHIWDGVTAGRPLSLSAAYRFRPLACPHVLRGAEC